jgi:hypothetical protein
VTNTDPSKNEDEPPTRIPTWVVLTGAIAFNAGGLLMLTVNSLADLGVPLLVLGLVAVWELAQRRRGADEDTHRGMVTTVAAMLLLATVVFVIAAVVPAAAEEASFGVVILFIALGFGLYEAWTWWKELQVQTEVGASGPKSDAQERQKRIALVLLAVLAAVGVIGIVTVLVISPGPLLLLGIALPLTVTAAVFAYKQRGRSGPSRSPW